jgi:hypothetical protein
MKRFFSWTVLAALLIAVGATLPAPAEAARAVPCTDAYEMCLNDSWDKSGWAEYLANLECAAQYAGCISKYLRP